MRLIHKSALAEFANAVYAYRDTIVRLWLITPWLSLADDARVDPIMLIVDALRTRKGCMSTIITRPPFEAWHQKSLSVLDTHLKPEGYFCKVLHTKLYAFECPGFTLAMFGSPNLTARANETNLELALEFRGVASERGDDVSRVIAGLMTYAADLRGEDSVRSWEL